MVYCSLWKRTLDSGAKVWVIDYEDPILGKRHRKHIAPVENLTAEEAKQVKHEMKSKLYRKQYPFLEDEDPGPPLKELRTEFIDYCQSKDLAASTIKRYQQAIKHLLTILGEDTPIGTLDFQDFLTWRRTRQETDTPKKKKPTNTGINVEHRSIKAMFNYAIKKRKYIETSPWVEEPQLPTPKKVKPVIQAKDIKKFFAVIDNPRDRLFFQCLYYYGFRPSEMVELRTEDLFLEEKIPYLIIRDRKGNDENELPILPALKDAFQKYVDEENDRIFIQFTPGQQWEPGNRMAHYLKQAGLPEKYSPKWFRHTFASNQSADHMGVKAVLGHSSIKVTEGYTHADLKRKLTIVKKQPAL